MTNRISLFIKTSLDGYIETQNDSIEWLFSADAQGGNGYTDAFADIDNIIMGSATYEWLLENEKEWPYKGKNAYVFSRSHVAQAENATFVNPDNLLSFTKELKGLTWIVGGGKVIRSFLENQLVDEITVAIAPVLLGEGIALFPEGDYKQNLELLGTRKCGQFVELTYNVKKD